MIQWLFRTSALVIGIFLSVLSGNADERILKPLSVELAVRQALKTGGYPFNVVTKGKYVIVSVSQYEENTSSGHVTIPAGLDVFGPESTEGRLELRCPNPIELSNGVTSVMGIKYLNSRKNRIGAAVECQGAEIVFLSNPGSCPHQGDTVQISQPSVPNCEEGQLPPGTFDLAISSDARFAFLANEYGTLPGMPAISGAVGTIGIVPLQQPGSSGYAVYIPGGSTIAGVTISRDGRRLYVTTELSVTDKRCGSSLTAPCNNPTNLGEAYDEKLVWNAGCYQKEQSGEGKPNGLLVVFDVKKLIQGKGQNALISAIASGCSPVRIVESRDGKTIWVAERGNDRLLSFDVAKLVSRNVDTVNSSYMGATRSGGTAPVGMTLFSKGRLLAVANSNRFNNPIGTSSLAIFDVRSRIPVQIGQLFIPPTVGPDSVSAFPRNVDPGSDDSTLYVSNYQTREVLVVDTVVSPGQ